MDIDVVNYPSHYTKGRIECIDAIDSATTGKSDEELARRVRDVAGKAERRK